MVIRFTVGDRVVYPMHGAGLIESVEEQQVLGRCRDYYVLRLPVGNMKVMVPVDGVEDCGLRAVMDPATVDAVLAVLAADVPPVTSSGNWNRRFRANVDKLKTGNPCDTAEVIRDLTHRERVKGLSSGERKMLENARRMLVSEIVLAAGIGEEVAEELIDRMLA